MTKTKNHHNIQYLDANNLHGCPVSQKLPVDAFKWEKIW